MSDDLGFDFDFGYEPTPESTPPHAPEPAPADVVSKADLEAFNARLSAQERRMQDTARFMATGESAQPQPTQLGYLLQTNPEAYAQTVLQQANQLAESKVAQLVVDNIVRDYKQQRPDLVPFEGMITARANQLAITYANQGKTASPAEIIGEAIKEFDQSLQAYSGSTRQQQQAQQAREAAIPFQVGSTANQNQRLSLTDALSAVGDDDRAFAQLEKRYFNSKGIRNF